ncbi:MAG: DUF1648 domain-containing protein [Sphingobacteriaceae bacterium]|nr:MAG: DUF1648 domain-containing protein [Sphingobacteriaceae bacterium]
MKGTHPKIKLKLATIDLVLEVLGWLSLALLWVLTIVNYPGLPETVPIHFNASGKADGYGSKATILLLPAISTVLYLAMTAINKYPHLFNYGGVKITMVNALFHYTNSTRLFRVLKIKIVLIFTVIVHYTNSMAMGQDSGLGKWLLPFILGMIFIPIVFYIIYTLRNKREEV